jgi:hypothetical protein
VSTTPSELPGPPTAQAAHPPTEIAGQQSSPSTAVPEAPLAPSYTPAGARTNTLAVVSLVAGIASFFAHIVPGVGGFTVALVAVVTGYMGRQQIKQTGEQGMWMATVGLVIGILHLALIAIVVLIILFVVFVLGIALFGSAAKG